MLREACSGRQQVRCIQDQEYRAGVSRRSWLARLCGFREGPSLPCIGAGRIKAEPRMPTRAARRASPPQLNGRPPMAGKKVSRPRSVAIDKLIGVPLRVLDEGFVRVLDYMGDDSAIVQAARVSYGAGTKRVQDDRGLIRYLLRHRH